ncbi:MAG: hypothetical protein SF066_19080 [Thermoanaerobaculia bacterium]|nr:hypothetical protein [Thermoanaerobaculia bacterium]
MNEPIDLPVTEEHEDRPNLDELLEHVTEENRHDEVATGLSVGREAW